MHSWVCQFLILDNPGVPVIGN